MQLFTEAVEIEIVPIFVCIEEEMSKSSIKPNILLLNKIIFIIENIIFSCRISVPAIETRKVQQYILSIYSLLRVYRLQKIHNAKDIFYVII